MSHGMITSKLFLRNSFDNSLVPMKISMTVKLLCIIYIVLLCRFAALPPHSPLRTVRASFPAYSSDNSKFNSHKIKSAHPRLYRQLFPIKFPFGTYVSGCVSASASRSRHPKSGRMDWLHISPLHVV